MSSQVQKTRGLDLLLKMENHIKSRIQHYERSELVLHFELPKVHFKNAKNDKSKAFGQTVLPDRSLFNRTKIVEKAKIQKFRCDILSDFQTLCCPVGKIISKLDEFSFFIPFPFFFCCPFSLEILHHFIGD